MTLQIQEINQYDITNSIFKIASIINKETIQLDYFYIIFIVKSALLTNDIDLVVNILFLI